jgi:class 3 adenylate cyclase
MQAPRPHGWRQRHDRRDRTGDRQAGRHRDGRWHDGQCTIAGIGIHVAARDAGVAPPGRSIVTSTVRDLLDGAMIDLDERGEHDLIGIARPWRLFAVPRSSLRTSSSRL